MDSSSLQTALSVVFPLVFMMGLGYFLRWRGLLRPDFLLHLNKLSFTAFFPILLFVNVYQSDFENDFSLPLILCCVGGIVAIFLTLMLLIPFLERDSRRRGVIVQGIFRSNFILYGIPVTASLVGSDNVSATAILIAFVVPTFNLLAVIALEVYNDRPVALKNIVMGIVKNPLIIGSVAAFVAVLIKIPIPELLLSPMRDIGKITTPLALIVLGGSLRFGQLRRDAWPLFWVSLGKLVAMPALFLGVALLLGVRGTLLIAVFALSVSPTAVSSYPMAEAAGADGELAGEIVAVTSVVSIVTVFLWTSLLKPFLIP